MPRGRARTSAAFSKKGSCKNQLHTHEGSAWSLVYHVDPGDELTQNRYGGRLVLKPTPHPKEMTSELGRLETKRFFNRKTTAQLVGVDCCDYLELDAVRGNVIIFPGWLHHCVLLLYRGREKADSVYSVL
jgi:hypothetical protein